MSEVDYIKLSGPRPVTMRGRADFSTPGQEIASIGGIMAIEVGGRK